MHSMQISWAVAKYRYSTSSTVIAAEYNYRTCNKNIIMQQPQRFHPFFTCLLSIL